MSLWRPCMPPPGWGGVRGTTGPPAAKLAVLYPDLGSPGSGQARDAVRGRSGALTAALVYRRPSPAKQLLEGPTGLRLGPKHLDCTDCWP